MLTPPEFQQVVAVSKIACKFMVERGYGEYLIGEISWNETENCWIVYTHPDAKKAISQILFIEPCGESYQCRGVIHK